MEKIFTDIYENKVWGDNSLNEYNGSSGEGSTVFFNKDTYIPFLKKIIIDRGIKTVVDLGCGDFLCGKLIYDDLNVTYTGYDVYKKIVDYNLKSYSLPKYNFMHLDILNKKEEIKEGDLCILKDILQHWNLNNIYAFLDYLVESKKFKYILICNCSNQKTDNTNAGDGGSMPLSCDYLPLKKYNPKKILNYQTKEICIIEI